MLPDKDPSPPVDASSGTHRLFAWFPAGFNLECPLLEALPFPQGVSSNLEELERLVAVAVDVEQPTDGRSEAFQSIRQQLRYCGMGESEILRFRLCLLSRMNGTGDSAQLTYAHIQVHVEECECSVLSATTAASQPCPPFVEVKKGNTARLDLPRIAAKASEELLAAFMGKNLLQLKRLGAKECTACIAILALYLQHGMHEKAKDSGPVENLITLRALQSLWRTLLKAIPDSFKTKIKDFSALYGEQAYLVLMHRISVHAPDCKINTEASDDIEGLATKNVSHARFAFHGFHLVVPGEIPPASDSDAKEIIQRLSNLKRPLPVVRLPTTEKLDAIRSKLLNEFPWAAAAIDAIMGELMTRKRFGSLELSFTSILLLGAPWGWKNAVGKAVGGRSWDALHVVGSGRYGR